MDDVEEVEEDVGEIIIIIIITEGHALVLWLLTQREDEGERIVWSQSVIKGIWGSLVGHRWCV